MKSLLLVNQSSGYLMVDIVNAFADSGIYDKVELFAGEINIRPSVPRDSVKVIKTIKYDKSSTIKRLVSWIGAFFHLLFVVWSRRKDCELFLVSNPPLTVFIPLFTRKKFSILVYDLYPDSLVAQHFVKKDSWIARQWRKINRKVYAKAQNVFTISDDMKRMVTQYVDENRISVVYNWVHNEQLKPIEKSENVFVKENGLEDKFLILYSGNMGMSHDIDVMVDVAEKLRDNHKIMFMFIGEGAKKQVIVDKIKEFKLDNCLVLPFQPKEVLPYSMGAADVAVVTTDLNQTGLSVPSKTYSYLSVGAVLLCLADKQSELGRMMNENHVGKCFDKTEIDAMAGFIHELCYDDILSQSYKVNSRNLSMQFTPMNAQQYVRNGN